MLLCAHFSLQLYPALLPRHCWDLGPIKSLVVNKKGACPFSTVCHRETSEYFLEEVMFKQVHKGHMEVRQAKGSGFWNELGECFR